MPVFAIRQATADDIDTVLEFSQKLFESDDAWFRNSDINWSYSKDGIKFNKDFVTDTKTKVCYLAVADNKIVGYVTGRIEAPLSAFPGKATRLMNIFVESEWRSRGAGAELVGRFYEWSRQQAADRVYVHAYSPNKKALRFYEQIGFEPYESVLRHKL